MLWNEYETDLQVLLGQLVPTINEIQRGVLALKGLGVVWQKASQKEHCHHMGARRDQSWSQWASTGDVSRSVNPKPYKDNHFDYIEHSWHHTVCFITMQTLDAALPIFSRYVDRQYLVLTESPRNNPLAVITAPPGCYWSAPRPARSHWSRPRLPIQPSVLASSDQTMTTRVLQFRHQ